MEERFPTFKGAEYYIGGIIDVDVPSVRYQNPLYVPDSIGGHDTVLASRALPIPE